LPDRAANEVYYFLQRRFGRLQRVDPLPYFEQALSLMRLSGAYHMLNGSTIFEVGTGRTVNIPFAFWLAGAARIITVDLNRYLRTELVTESIQACRTQRRQIIDLFARYGVPLMTPRLETLLACPTAAAAFSVTQIDYHAPADAAQTQLPDSTVDLHISINVLEHISSQVLGNIFAEARRILRPHGLLLHQVDPSDHFAQTDPALHLAHFLRYSQARWDRIAGNQFMYQNRLRAPEYLRLIAAAGFAIGETRTEQDARTLAELKSGFPIHPDFSRYSLEELATTKLAFAAERR
jgi:SAM-dependent methyltransferase